MRAGAEPHTGSLHPIWMLWLVIYHISCPVPSSRAAAAEGAHCFVAKEVNVHSSSYKQQII